jgi:hypothetical protein
VKKTTLITALLLAALLIAVSACGEKATTTTNEDVATTTTESTEAAPAATDDASSWNGEVLETMNSGGYTYVHVDTGAEKIWAAATESATAITVGQRVTVPKGMMMKNFPSKTLDRTFEEIYFVGGIYVEGAQPNADGGMPQDSNHAGAGGMGGATSGEISGNANNTVPDAKIEGVNKVSGGYTVAEVFAQASSLNGQTVKVRGRVTKFTANIMGTNWVHLQDGTEGDLTVTTSAVVATGDLVVVEGPLAANKDFGAGYKYAAIIEKASITKE